MNIKLFSTTPLMRGTNLVFMGNMSQQDLDNWNNSEPYSVYANLQDLMIDLNDIDEKNNRNCLHYILKHDNPAIFDELKFRLEMFDKDDLEKLLNQTDIYGKAPLDYCPNSKLRKKYENLFNEELGKNFVQTSFNEAVKANYMPGEQIYPRNAQPVGNELPEGSIIPVSDDLEMNFGEEANNAKSQISTPTEASELETQTSIIQNTTENVPRVDDSDFEFDNYKSELGENTEREEQNEPKGLDDIIGQENIKELLRQNLIKPLKKENLDKLDNNNLKIENGFLFYGPPECGKTFLIKALAKELNMPLKELSSIAELQKIKDEASNRFKTKQQPTLVCIDNIDEKIDKNKIDTTADIISDCAQNGIILLAATNKYDDLDPRFTESSCFNQIIEVPLPAYSERILIIKSVLDKCIKDINNQITDEDVQALARSTSGFPNAAISYVVEKSIKEQIVNENGVLNISDIKTVIEEFARTRKIGKLMDDNPTSVYDTYLKRSIIDSPKDFSDVAGMNAVKETLTNSIVKRLQPEIRSKFEAEEVPLFNDGFLFFGPPGCGKTYIAEALAGETKLPLYKIDKSVYDTSYKGESIKNIRKIFEQLFQKFEETGEYSILFVDEADAIFPKRGTAGNFRDEETNTMLQYLNNCTRKGIIPILATNFKDKIDTAVLRSGRIGTHIEIPTPDFEARKELFRLNIKDKQITKFITEENLIELANMLEGFASCDISHIVKSTIDSALINGKETLTIDDFKESIKTYAKQRDLSTDFSPNDRTVQYDTFKKRERIKYPHDFGDVAGMETTKEQLRRSIVNKLKPEIRERFENNRMPLFNDGFMLYGKPGNGKTFIVEALAGETGLPLYKVTKADYDTKYKGEAGNNIDKIFRQLERKFEKTGEYSLLFFDEADAIFPKRGTTGNFNDEETNLMLTFLNNAPSRGIIPILATNYSEKIDSAVLRSGRIGTHIEIPSPDFEARKSMFERLIKDKEITRHITNDDIDSLARMLNGFCVADISHLTIATIEKAINDKKDELTVDDFKEAIKNFSHERNIPEVNEINITSQYDTFKKREQIKYPHDFSDVAGMETTKEQLRRSIVNKLKPGIREKFENNKLPLFNDGFMLYGKPGNGKTFIVEALAGETNIPLYKVTKADYDTKYKGEAGNNIEKIFRQLEYKFERTGEYSLLFFDEADAIFPKRGTSDNYSDEETNLMLTFLNNAPSKGIIPILATNYSDKIDSAVLRSGRIGTHIEIPSPDFEARKSIFERLIKDKEIAKKIKSDDIDSLARMLNGFCAADIRHLTVATIEKAISDEKEELTVDDFKEAIKNFSHERNIPEVNEFNVTSQYDTILKRVQIKAKDPHSLEEIGGMKEAKEALYESVIMANDPAIKKLNEENGIDSPNGILLYGPPGCGKTYIMKAVASEAKLPLYQMKMSEMGSKYVNETSSNIKSVFEQLKNKFEKTGEPSILFLDECDSFFSSNMGLGGNSERNQDLNTLKEEMNNAGRNGIIIVAATNEIQNINPAILRDGRFDTKVYVGVPDREARYDIIKKDLTKHRLTSDLADNEDGINQLVAVSEGLATVSIVTAITDLLRKTIANKKKNGGDLKITIQDIAEAIKEKVSKNEKLQKDIAERAFRL